MLTRIPLSSLFLILLGGVGDCAFAQRQEQLARHHVEGRLLHEGYRMADIREAIVTGQHTSPHNGVTHLYYQQVYEGLEVHGAVLNTQVDRHGNALTTGNRFRKHLGTKHEADGGILQPEIAVRMAAVALEIEAAGTIRVLSRSRGVDRSCRMTGGRISRDEIPAKLKYFATDDGELRKVWNLVIRPFSGDHWWDVCVSAEDGKLVCKADWIKQESYRVFDLPLRSPSEGPRSLVVDPYDPVASPFGWHDTDGVPGAEFTDTRGNNVVAQEDGDSDNAGGIRPDGGGNLVFDFPLDLSQLPSNNLASVVAQIFYLNNLCHDIHYQYGFTEAAGNFQENNYGRGGSGGDPVQADALDGAGVNNANFGTPPDGTDPRMQMFVWRFAELEVESPANIAGPYATGSAEFGAQLVTTVLSGLVAQAFDASTTAGPSLTDCCTPITNPTEVAGRIALIDRGDCLFVEKVKNAQDAGAIGVIVANNAGDEVITMGGSDPAITIPAVFVGQSHGATLRSEVSNNLHAVLSGGSVGSSFDIDIVVHEYGHGVSTRLTGGPANSGCLDGIQSGGMGEGWSDWWSLVLAGKASESELSSIGVGTFVAGQAATGPGIRRFPYSTDLGVCPLTYSWVVASSEVHDVGEIWCAALWDMYWFLVNRHGFDPDLYAGTGGNNIALQLVMDGLKIQPCNPTFLDARDAILAADQADYGGANQCEIWSAFARRGMGENAADGGNHNSTNVVEDFSAPVNCTSPRIHDIAKDRPLEIRWRARDGDVYRVQESATILQPAWSNVSGAVTSSGISASAMLPLTNGADRLFLRVTLEE